jgi:hypothetical protein
LIYRLQTFLLELYKKELKSLSTKARNIKTDIKKNIRQEVFVFSRENTTIGALFISHDKVS